VQYTVGIFFDKGYNFALDLTSIKAFHTKLWASKITGVPILGISKLPFRGHNPSFGLATKVRACESAGQM
jgi:hypothetical protein